LKTSISCFIFFFMGFFFISNIYCEELPEIKELREELEVLKEEIRTLKDEAEVRKTLRLKEVEKVQKKSVEDILKASVQRYTLLKKNHLEIQDTLSYSYYADDEIVTLYDASDEFSGLRIDHSKEHTIVNTVQTTYGMFNNLSIYAALPFIFKYEKSGKKEETDIGDIAFGLQYQPFKGGGEWPETILNWSFKTKTGKSQYEINPETELSTGSGCYSTRIGINASKVIDPVVLFGSVAYTYKFEEDGLHQKQSDDLFLTKVDPGESFSYSIGFGYAMSYKISFTAQFQQSYSHDIAYWINDKERSGYTENTAMLIFGTGIRLSRKTSLYVNVGTGLTKDSSDFVVSLRIPIEYSLD